MNSKEFQELDEGDKVRLHSDDGFAYSVMANYTTSVTAARVIMVTNPSEWVTDNRRISHIGELRQGSVILNTGSGRTYVVTSVHSDYAIAAHSVEITPKNRAEWRIVVKAKLLEIT